MAIPVLVWAGGAAIVALGIGAGSGSRTAAREIGEGIGAGAKFGLPIMAAATAVYLVMQVKKK